MDFSINQNIRLGLSAKADGPMKNSPTNRLTFLKHKNLDKKIVVSAGLIHSNKVTTVNGLSHNFIIPNCDALITSDCRYLLTITVADCLPLYFYDNKKQIVAVAHAGWRGVVSQIAKEVVGAFVNNYGSNLKDIEVFIGPHIKDCHFEVKGDVAANFKISETIIRNKKIYINLAGVVTSQLLDRGISETNIRISSECTFCSHDKYFSWRRDKPRELETMVAYIGLK